MGYSTEFKGTLKFKSELKASQLHYLNSLLGKDCRNHPEWGAGASGLYRIDLSLTDDFSGIEWSGAEKTYSMEKLVNVVIELMKDQWSDFGITGKLIAQGEDIDDRWELVIEEGQAVRRDVVVTGQRITCPHCEFVFILESFGK